MRTPLVLFIVLLSFALGNCSPFENVVEDLQSTVPENTESTHAGTTTTPGSTMEATAMVPSEEANANATAMTEASITPPAAVETGAWAEYQNPQAGYSVEYPSDWTVTESTGQNGVSITMFMAPTGEQGITVSVLDNEAVAQEIPDMPNTRCEQIMINGLSGLRCFDTLAFSTSTTFLSHGKQYAVVTTGKHPDQNIYQRFLEGFSITS